MTPPADQPTDQPADQPADQPTEMAAFDLLGELPQGPTTTVLEASAGTGKTYALAGLVARYVAEGHATLDEMLLITFGRAASQELRERVRDQLVAAAAALEACLGSSTAGPSSGAGRPASDALLEHLCSGPDDALRERHDRLRDALAGFDAATIATTHQFCQIVLRSLGVAGDSDAGLTLVESLDELTEEVVDDLYLQRFGDLAEAPVLSRADALDLAKQVVANPRATLTPSDPPPGSPAAVRCGFAADVLAELERRKRRLGVLGFDDLLGRLAETLLDDEAPARERMRRRWRFVMVDEFQDTDPTQWEVIERAFVGHATVVLIGDPKQAIYAFRGGDITTYLAAAARSDARLTLATNWRSDADLVERLQVLMRGAALGHDDIVVREIEAHHQGHRLADAGERGAPVRLRVVGRDVFDGLSAKKTVKMDDLRPWVAADLAADVKALLASGATYDGRAVQAGDVAVIVEAHKDARACRDALAAAGVPAVYTGDSDVFASPAAADWLALLEAFEQPHRTGLVRAAAGTMFVGLGADELARGGDELTDRVAATVRRWADHARERGVAAVLEAALVDGMAERVLSWRGGERHMTDLEHVGQLLHEVAHRERLGLPALLDWLRQQTRDRAGAPERNRRLDSDAAAVQIITVWVSKGLQYPIVYLPFAFNRYLPPREVVLYHDDDRRCLDIGGKQQPGFRDVEARGRQEMAADDIRLTYVALTRAQSQVVAWWAPSWDEPNGGLSRLLRGRRQGDTAVPDRVDLPNDDHSAVACFRQWEAAGAISLERAAIATPGEPAAPAPPTGLDVRRFDRSIDLGWQRTSYSGLIRDVDDAHGTPSEPEVRELDDESDLVEAAGSAEQAEGAVGAEGADAAERDPVSPMAALPAGATFGSLVHGVLEVADPDAPDRRAELAGHVREQLVWWSVEASVDDLTDALLPVLDSPLGPLAPGLALGDVPLRDRLCELDFEIPLAGGDRAGARPGDQRSQPRLGDVGRLLRTHLATDDALAPYADRLTDSALAAKPLRGYLSGSIDVVLRVAHPDGDGSRYLVVDYKTNRLVEADVVARASDFAPERLREAMLHSDYPLQALLYTVVTHRYLRWRQPGYDPDRHLGGVLYLYVRGMCGAATPLHDGHPCGVFSWTPPAALVLALSDLLDGRGSAR